MKEYICIKNFFTPEIYENKKYLLCIDNELNKDFKIDEMSEFCYFDVYDESGKILLTYVYRKNIENFFIPLSEYRNNKINTVLE